jgi:hypothetical protein
MLVVHTHGQNNPSLYFKREFFFWRPIFICKTIGNCFFFLLTNLAMESGITDEKKADSMFLSVKALVKKLLINYESYTDGILSSVKL